jgi:aromatic ring-opening dioxygenase catalytic subunit (LigB family)
MLARHCIGHQKACSNHCGQRTPGIASSSYYIRCNAPQLYDYSGFPEESYEIRYPCPGEPSVAQEIHKLPGYSGIQAALDADRGFDHGPFVHLKIMYP